MQHWINQSEQALQARPSLLNTPQVDKLEKELVYLKSFNNDISEQLAKIVALSQGAEQIAPAVAPEGQAAIKDRIAALRARVAKLSEDIRGKINIISDAIISRQDFNAQMANFSTQMDRLRYQAAQVDDVSSDRLEPHLHIVHNLLQEHSDMKNLFKSIYEEVKTMTLNAKPDESRAINDSYTALVLNYQNIEDDLQQKREAMEKWAEFISWKNDIESNANHLKQQLSNSNNNVDALKKIMNEISANMNAIAQRRPQANDIDNRMAVHLRDPTNGRPMNAQQILNNLDNLFHNLQLKTQNQMAALSKVEAQKGAFIDIENNLAKMLTDIRSNLDQIESSVESPEQLITNLNTLNIQVQNLLPLKERMHEQGTQLMHEDMANMPAIQESILVLNKRFDEIQQDIGKCLQKFTQMNQSAQDYAIAKKRFDDEIAKAEKLYASIQHEPKGEHELIEMAAKSKNALDQIRKCKHLLDDMDIRGIQLAKLYEPAHAEVVHIDEDIKGGHAKWQRLHELLAQNTHQYETQTIIYSQLEQLKSELLFWLDDTIASLNDAASNTLSIEYGPIR